MPARPPGTRQGGHVPRCTAGPGRPHVPCCVPPAPRGVDWVTLPGPPSHSRLEDEEGRGGAGERSPCSTSPATPVTFGREPRPPAPLLPLPAAPAAGSQAPPSQRSPASPPTQQGATRFLPFAVRTPRLNFLRTSYRSVFAFLFTRLFYFLSVFPKTEVPRGQKLCPLSPANSKLSN